MHALHPISRRHLAATSADTGRFNSYSYTDGAFSLPAKLTDFQIRPDRPVS